MIQRLASLPLLLLSSALFLVFVSYVLPQYAAESSSYTSLAKAPDLRLVYSADDVQVAAQAWGKAGRRAYVASKYGFDVLWPLVYTLFLSACLAYLLSKVDLANSAWSKLASVPLAAMLLDFAENVCLGVSFAMYPDMPAWALLLAPWFTLSKWLLVSASFVAVFALAALLIKQKSTSATG